MSDASQLGFSDADWEQTGLFDDQLAKQALDEPFRLTRQYRSSEAYYQLLQFVGHFRFYSPFNALLVHIQMPGATYVAPPHRWLVTLSIVSDRALAPWSFFGQWVL
jgi:hypothetical protein